MGSYLLGYHPEIFFNWRGFAKKAQLKIKNLK
jgi:hypothetical protein